MAAAQSVAKVSGSASQVALVSGAGHESARAAREVSQPLLWWLFEQ